MIIHVKNFYVVLNTLLGMFITDLVAPGTKDEMGQSHLRKEDHASIPFQIPCTSPPAIPGAAPQPGGSNRDMGSVALLLVANWYINGETVLVDGGVSLLHPHSSIEELTSTLSGLPQAFLLSPSSY